MTSGPKHYYSGLFRALLILLLILYKGRRMVYRVTGHKTRKELTNWCFRRVLSLQPTYTESLSFFSFPFPAVKSRFSWGQSNVLIRGLPPRLPLAAGGASVYPQGIRLEPSTFASQPENGRGRPRVTGLPVQSTFFHIPVIPAVRSRGHRPSGNRSVEGH